MAEHQLYCFAQSGNAYRGFDIPAQHKSIAAWLDRIRSLPGWRHPYDLMPGRPLPAR